MSESLVFSFIGADKPGLIESISQAVSEAGGNWLESRMSQLAGQFAGIARIDVSNAQLAALEQALQGLAGDELSITLQSCSGSAGSSEAPRKLSILGSDRPGIVMEVTRALAARKINVCEMNTAITSAPMTAEALFEANALVDVPAGLDEGELAETLDGIANELCLDIAFEGG